MSNLIPHKCPRRDLCIANTCHAQAIFCKNCKEIEHRMHEFWNNKFKNYWDQHRQDYEGHPMTLISKLLKVLESNFVNSLIQLRQMIHETIPDVELLDKFNNVMKWNNADARECLKVFSYNPDKKIIKILREISLNPPDPTGFAKIFSEELAKIQSNLACVINNIKVQMNKVYQPFGENMLGKRKSDKAGITDLEDVIKDIGKQVVSINANVQQQQLLQQHSPLDDKNEQSIIETTFVTKKIKKEENQVMKNNFLSKIKNTDNDDGENKQNQRSSNLQQNTENQVEQKAKVISSVKTRHGASTNKEVLRELEVFKRKPRKSKLNLQSKKMQTAIEQEVDKHRSVSQSSSSNKSDSSHESDQEVDVKTNSKLRQEGQINYHKRRRRRHYKVKKDKNYDRKLKTLKEAINKKKRITNSLSHDHDQDEQSRSFDNSKYTLNKYNKESQISSSQIEQLQQQEGSFQQQEKEERQRIKTEHIHQSSSSLNNLQNLSQQQYQQPNQKQLKNVYINYKEESNSPSRNSIPQQPAKESSPENQRQQMKLLKKEDISGPGSEKENRGNQVITNEKESAFLGVGSVSESNNNLDFNQFDLTSKNLSDNQQLQIQNQQQQHIQQITQIPTPKPIIPGLAHLVCIPLGEQEQKHLCGNNFQPMAFVGADQNFVRFFFKRIKSNDAHPMFSLQRPGMISCLKYFQFQEKHFMVLGREQSLEIWSLSKKSLVINYQLGVQVLDFFIVSANNKDNTNVSLFIQSANSEILVFDLLMNSDNKFILNRKISVNQNKLSVGYQGCQQSPIQFATSIIVLQIQQQQACQKFNQVMFAQDQNQLFNQQQIQQYQRQQQVQQSQLGFLNNIIKSESTIEQGLDMIEKLIQNPNLYNLQSGNSPLEIDETQLESAQYPLKQHVIGELSQTKQSQTILSLALGNRLLIIQENGQIKHQINFENDQKIISQVSACKDQYLTVLTQQGNLELYETQTFSALKKVNVIECLKYYVEKGKSPQYNFPVVQEVPSFEGQSYLLNAPKGLSVYQSQGHHNQLFFSVALSQQILIFRGEQLDLVNVIQIEEGYIAQNGMTIYSDIEANQNSLSLTYSLDTDQIIFANIPNNKLK